MSYRTKQSRAGLKAFSLIELLVVIAIMLMLMTLLVPAFANISRAQNLTTTSQMVVDSFNFARQTASTQNRRVEARFYKLNDDINPTNKVYRAMQLFLVQTTGLQPITRVIRFPGGVIMAEDTTLSTVLTNISSTNSFSLPDVGTNYLYASLQFLPSGETDLRQTNTWTTTLMHSTDQKGTGVLPNNYATARIDPASGKLSIFRP